jgi:hypothetical protein
MFAAWTAARAGLERGRRPGEFPALFSLTGTSFFAGTQAFFRLPADDPPHCNAGEEARPDARSILPTRKYPFHEDASHCWQRGCRDPVRVRGRVPRPPPP